MDAIAPSPPTPLPRFTGARGGLCGQAAAGREWSHAKPRSREAAKEGRWRAVFEYEYEYEYRPPGRTEYEYEGVGQWAVGRLGLTRSREAAKGNAVGLLWCVLSCLVSSQLSHSVWSVAGHKLVCVQQHSSCAGPRGLFHCRQASVGQRGCSGLNFFRVRRGARKS